MNTTHKTYDQLPFDIRRCPGCNHVKGNTADARGVYTCTACGGIFSERLYLGDSYSYVLPYMEMAQVPVEDCRYFDFTCLGSKGIERRHGFYYPPTKRITQVG